MSIEMSLTPEEILQRNCPFGIPLKNAIMKSMEEYAVQQSRLEAIAFAEWIDGEMYECFLMTDEGVKHWHDLNGKGNWTTEQLYNLFIKDTNQKLNNGK